MARMCSDGLERKSRFPVGLLAAGYTIGSVAGLATYLLGAGLIAGILVFWIGGAVATLGIAALLIYGGNAVRRVKPRGWLTIIASK